MTDQAAVSFAMSLGMSNAIGLFAMFGPRLIDVRRSDTSDTELVADMRYGEVIAGGIALITGVVGSYLTKDPLPLVTAAVIVTAMVVVYEYTLMNRPMSPK